MSAWTSIPPSSDDEGQTLRWVGTATDPVSVTAQSVESSPVSPSPPTVTPTAADPLDPIPHLRAVDSPGAGDAPHQSVRLPSGIEPVDVVRSLLENAKAAGTAIAAHLWLSDPASSTLRLVHAEGPARPDSTPVSIEGTTLGVALTRRTAQLHAVHRLRTTSGQAVVWRYALPLTAGDAQGVAGVDFQGPSQPDMAQFTPIAGAMRAALAGALALQIARAESLAAQTLADTSRDLARLLDPDEVVTTTLERAMALAGAQTGSVMLLDEDGALRIAASRGLPPEVVVTTRVTEGEGIAGWVLASRQSLVVEDLEDRGPQGHRHGVRSAVSTPIADDDGILGVLNVGSRTFHARFSRSNLVALESLGRTTAGTLRNARAVSVAQELYFDTL